MKNRSSWISKFCSLFCVKGDLQNLCSTLVISLFHCHCEHSEGHCERSEAISCTVLCVSLRAQRSNLLFSYELSVVGVIASGSEAISCSILSCRFPPLRAAAKQSHCSLLIVNCSLSPSSAYAHAKWEVRH